MATVKRCDACGQIHSGERAETFATVKQLRRMGSIVLFEDLCADCEKAIVALLTEFRAARRGES